MNWRDLLHRVVSNPRQRRMVALIVCLVAGAFLFSCSRNKEAKIEFSYPQPRFPRYLAKPNKDDLLKGARYAVRQPVGRCPLGKIESGQTVHVFIQWGQDMQTWEAIRQAWAEKDVKAYAVGYWDIMGITKEEYERRMAPNVVHGSESWKELGNFRVEYKPFFPEDIQKQFGDPITDETVRLRYTQGYLDKHPEVKHIYAGEGGGNFWTRALGKHGDKFQGNWIYIRPIDLLTKAAEFPADVWSLVDEKILRPVPFISEVTFEDPEGTSLHWTLTPDESKFWRKNTGASNHIYVYPNPLHSILAAGGIIVAHANHTGIYPTMTVRLDTHGGIQSIEGGGRVGELFRTLVNQPVFQQAKFPKAPEPGYWFLRQDGFATNPKFVRNLPALIEGEPWMANLSERNRAGIQHLAFSYDSDDPEDLAYAKQKGIPLGNGEHDAHMHNHFPTIRWKLRDTGEWVSVAEKGYVKMFDDPEVRALAARYGDPNLIFRYEWIPSLPGINVAGNYQKDFSPDPWGWLMAEWKRIQDGTYQYFIEDYALSAKQVAQSTGNP